MIGIKIKIVKPTMMKNAILLGNLMPMPLPIANIMLHTKRNRQ